MAATPLSPTGSPSFDGPKTCDASGMIEIHRMLRHSFHEASGLVAGVAPGDTRHAARVASQLHLISTALHAHHEGEDARLWGTLEDRAPTCAVHVERMKQQHADMLVQLVALDAAMPEWQASASNQAAVPVMDALHGVTHALSVHLPDEEAHIVPVIEHVVTASESKWFAAHGRSATPKGQMWNMLGAILAAQPDGGRQWLKANMPGFGRLMWRLVGAPRYRRFRAAIEAR